MNKKVLIILIVLVIVIIGTIITMLLVNKDDINNEFINPYGETQADIRVTGRLKTLLEGLGNNYQIKYSGKFKNETGEEVQAIVEYTRRESDHALKANELEMHLVKEGDILNSVSKRYQMIVKMRPTSFDISTYNLISDMGQTYIKSSKKKLDGKNYDVEEYKLNENSIEYYFLDGQIKRIMYNDKEIKVLRVEKNVNTLLFDLPRDYSIVNT